MSLLLFVACNVGPTIDDGTVVIDAVTSEPTNTGLDVYITLSWSGDFPAIGASVEGQTTTLTVTDSGHASTSVSLPESLLAAADLRDGAADGAGDVRIVAWSASSVSDEYLLPFSTDPTPETAVDSLEVEAIALDDDYAGVGYLPANGTVPVFVNVQADSWAAGETATSYTTGATAAPTSGPFVLRDGNVVFSFTSGASTSSASAGGAGVLTVGASAGSLFAYEQLPVVGAPKFVGGATQSVVTSPTSSVAAGFVVVTAGTLERCRATSVEATAVSVGVRGGAYLLVAGVSQGWVDMSGATLAALDVTGPAGPLEDRVWIECQDPWGQAGEVQVDLAPEE